jgi:hypothetical protein
MAWETLKEITIETGKNNFIEVSIKKAPDGNEMFGISKGWFNSKGEKIYKGNIIFSKEKKEEIIEALNSLDIK